LIVNNYCRDPVILAVGDSITQGVYTTNPPATAYPHLLELKLEQTYHRNFISINAAVGGVWSNYFINPNAAPCPCPHPTMADLIDTYQPDLVLLMIGTNDFGGSADPSTIDNNIRQTISNALNKGVRVIIASNPPVDDLIRDWQFNNIYEFVVNQERYSLMATYFGIPYARVFSAFYFNTPNWQYLFPDQLHPNNTGHEIIRDVFYDQVVPLLDQKGCFR
jgi:lysophospholipase L1-like esterase